MTLTLLLTSPSLTRNPHSNHGKVGDAESESHYLNELMSTPQTYAREPTHVQTKLQERSVPLQLEKSTTPPFNKLARVKPGKNAVSPSGWNVTQTPSELSQVDTGDARSGTWEEITAGSTDCENKSCNDESNNSIRDMITDTMGVRDQFLESWGSSRLSKSMSKRHPKYLDPELKVRMRQLRLGTVFGCRFGFGFGFGLGLEQFDLTLLISPS